MYIIYQANRKEFMGREIRANRQQGMLFPPHVEDFVPIDHPARFINEFVDSLDLPALGFTIPESDKGHPYYAIDLMLKVWLYGYYKKIRSSRGLEKECRESIALVWLSGMHFPDHNTLWRFYSKNKKGMRNVFKKSVHLAYRSNMIGLILQAVDGTKVASRVSKRSGFSRKHLEKLLVQLDKVVAEMNREIEDEESKGGERYGLPEELQDQKKLRVFIKDTLKEMDDIDRDNLNPNDPDSRMMKVSGKKEYGYNGQIVVDSSNQIIVAEDVSQDESDNDLLTEMIDQEKETLGEVAEETLADNGYFKGEQLSKAEEKGYEVLVDASSYHASIGARGKFKKDQFKYIKEEDVVLCPYNKHLVFYKEEYNKKRTFKYRVYICKDYKDCPFRDLCSKNKKGRTIRLNPNEKAINNQIEKQKDLEKKNLLSKRKHIVEPVFGTIKEVMGFRRFTVTGLGKVQVQWAMVCLAFNLKKLYQYWTENKLVLA
jgi:transposase